MTSRTIWTSFDGIEFDNEQDCLAHEAKFGWKQLTKTYGIYFFNYEGESVPVNDKNDYNDKVYYVVISTPEAYALLKTLCDKEEMSVPQVPPDYDWKKLAFFWFDLVDGEWVDLSKHFSHIKNIMMYFFDR